MNLLAPALGLAALVGACATAPHDSPTAFTIEVFNSRSNKVEHIPVKLHLPASQAAAKPAVIMMGGCDGSLSSGARELTRRLVAAGAVVAELQSIAAHGNQCMTSTHLGVNRSDESFLARDSLVKRGLAAESNVGLLGFSHGGWAITHAMYMDTTSLVRPSVPFAAAVAFYPYCAAINIASLALKTPSLLMVGSADTWTPAWPCRQMVDNTAPHGLPLVLHEYPGATHSWDNQKPNREMQTGAGWVQLAYDPAAARDSVDRAFNFLRSTLAF